MASSSFCSLKMSPSLMISPSAAPLCVTLTAVPSVRLPGL